MVVWDIFVRIVTRSFLACLNSSVLLFLLGESIHRCMLVLLNLQRVYDRTDQLFFTCMPHCVVGLLDEEVVYKNYEV